jgi:hypothetical protein
LIAGTFTGPSKAKHMSILSILPGPTASFSSSLFGSRDHAPKSPIHATPPEHTTPSLKLQLIAMPENTN